MGTFRQAPAPYADREYAGRRIAEDLLDLHDQPDTLVVGLARGGVPVAAAVGRTLGAPFEALVVRKLGVPGYEEVAFGALAAHGKHIAEVRVPRVMDEMATAGTQPAAMAEVFERERTELLRRQQSFLRGRAPDMDGRTVILCDDGLATGATMRAAIEVVRMNEPASLVVAVPVGPPEVCAEIAALADRFVCPLQPAGFRAVGAFYAHFPQLTDDEVLRVLGG